MNDIENFDIDEAIKSDNELIQAFNRSQQPAPEMCGKKVIDEMLDEFFASQTNNITINIHDSVIQDSFNEGSE